jgi:HlyD family secretion protein
MRLNALLNPATPVTPTLQSPTLQSMDAWHSTAPWIRSSKSALGIATAVMIAFSFISISGAVVTSGTVSVESNYKTIQHLDGGIVAKILVKNGDRVKEGDVLIRLDDTQIKASLGVTKGRLNDALIQRARLESERDLAPVFRLPEAILTDLSDPHVQRMAEAQKALFEARRISRKGEQSVLGEKRDQINSEINGLNHQLSARRRELDLNDRELKNVLPLFERGFVNQQRLSPLQKDQARLEGEVGRITGDMARAKSAFAEADLKLAQGDKEFLSQVVDELRKVQSLIGEANEQLTALNDKVARAEIRAPRTGRMHALAVTTEGGVVTPAGAIGQVIPDGEKLIVEVKLQPQDIDKVRGGLIASVRFPAFNAKTTPKIDGLVTTVSPAQINDPQGQGRTYFTAQIELPSSELAKLPKEHQLIPGMPAEVFIETSSRSIMSYIIKPLIDTFSHVGRD